MHSKCGVVKMALHHSSLPPKTQQPQSNHGNRKKNPRNLNGGIFYKIADQYFSKLSTSFKPRKV